MTPELSAILSAVASVLTALGAARIFTVRQDRVKAKNDATKAGADAATAITEAATTLVEPLSKRVTELIAEVGQLDDKVNLLQAEIRIRDELATAHAGWDYIVEEKLRAAGITVPARPPLRPDPPH